MNRVQTDDCARALDQAIVALEDAFGDDCPLLDQLAKASVNSLLVLLVALDNVFVKVAALADRLDTYLLVIPPQMRLDIVFKLPRQDVKLLNRLYESRASVALLERTKDGLVKDLVALAKYSRGKKERAVGADDTSHAKVGDLIAIESVIEGTQEQMKVVR